MKKLITSSIFCVLLVQAFSQAAYVLPSPTAAEQELTIYLDISLSVDGSQNNALRAMLIDNPDEDVYLWTWQPGDPVDGNGDWDSSNETNKMTKIGPLLYSFTMFPTEFYGVDGSTLFANGISCLAKLKDGNAFEDEGYDGEAKSEDFVIDIVPKLCDRKFCVFPEIRQADDYVSITYDNTQETIEGLANIPADDCYLYIVGSSDPFFFSTYEVSPLSEVTSNPNLKLKALDGEETGMFRFTFIPEELFPNVPEGESLVFIKYYILIPGFEYPPGPPPFEDLSILLCE